MDFDIPILPKGLTSAIAPLAYYANPETICSLGGETIALCILIASEPNQRHKVISPTQPAPFLGRAHLDRVFLCQYGTKTLEILFNPATRKVARLGRTKPTGERGLEAKGKTTFVI